MIYLHYASPPESWKEYHNLETESIDQDSSSTQWETLM